MANYRIVALDGGGLRGIISARLLQRLENEHVLPHWYRKAELVGGTSTGGILALGIGAGFSAAELVDFYRIEGPKIFADSWFDDVHDLGNLVGAKYSTAPRNVALLAHFGASTLADLPKAGVAGLNPQQKTLVTAFDLCNEAGTTSGTQSWKPKIFHNFQGPDSDGALPVVKAALYTSAAPTYFPSVDGYIDGGVFANNPSMVCLGQALDARRGPGVGLQQLRLFSVGTGFVTHLIRQQAADWGVAQWAHPLIDLLQDGVSDIARYQCRQLLDDRFRRLQPVLTQVFALDDVKSIDAMLAFADGVNLDADAAWLRANW